MLYEYYYDFPYKDTITNNWVFPVYTSDTTLNIHVDINQANNKGISISEINENSTFLKNEIGGYLLDITLESNYIIKYPYVTGSIQNGSLNISFTEEGNGNVVNVRRSLTGTKL